MILLVVNSQNMDKLTCRDETGYQFGYHSVAVFFISVKLGIIFLSKIYILVLGIVLVKIHKK
jgi:hypothetical protein